LINNPNHLWLAIEGLDIFQKATLLLFKTGKMTPYYRQELTNETSYYPLLNLMTQENKLKKRIKKLKNRIIELTGYLDSYDLKLIEQKRKKEKLLEAKIGSLMKQGWFIEGVKKLKNAEPNIDKNCPNCPFFRYWLKKAFKREYGEDISNYESRVELLEEKR
jgi:hypothetical protein